MKQIELPNLDKLSRGEGCPGFPRAGFGEFVRFDEAIAVDLCLEQNCAKF
jgi:hypothetical protein